MTLQERLSIVIYLQDIQDSQPDSLGTGHLALVIVNCLLDMQYSLSERIVIQLSARQVFSLSRSPIFLKEISLLITHWEFHFTLPSFILLLPPISKNYPRFWWRVLHTTLILTSEWEGCPHTRLLATSLRCLSTAQITTN